MRPAPFSAPQPVPFLGSMQAAGTRVLGVLVGADLMSSGPLTQAGGGLDKELPPGMPARDPAQGWPGPEVGAESVLGGTGWGPGWACVLVWGRPLATAFCFRPHEGLGFCKQMEVSERFLQSPREL